MIKKSFLAISLALFAFSCTQKTNENNTPQEEPVQVVLNLTDNTWNLQELNGKSIDIDTSFNGFPHITFEATENKIVGNAGCNRFFGTYETGENNGLSLSQMGATMMACPNLDLEQEFLKALEGVKSFQIEGKNMSLLNSENQVIAKFENMVQIKDEGIH